MFKIQIGVKKRMKPGAPNWTFLFSKICTNAKNIICTNLLDINQIGFNNTLSQTLTI